MPVTAKLSREFYKRLGEQATNELVDWFNKVDATYRADLRELNELNFARFDAKLEQRFAELSARIDQLSLRFDGKLDQRVGDLGAKTDQRVAELSARIDQLGVRFDAKLEASLSALKAELIKWMFLFWAGTALAGLLLP